MKYEALNPEIFVNNRARFVNKLPAGSAAIFHSNDEMVRNGDCFYEYRENSDFFWMTGIDQEQSIFVVFPDAPVPHLREVLFLRKTNEHIAIWEGHKFTKEEAITASGIKNVYWLEDYESFEKTIMHYAKTVFVNANENDRAITEYWNRDLRMFDALKKRFPLHQYDRSAPILAELRAVKSDLEVDLIKKACSITEKTFRRVLGFVKPGVMEYEVEAEIIHEFTRNRANGHAYSPIVASGGNACCLHYTDNNTICNDGDLLLMDFGAEYANYASDLTRTIPVNGKFTERQKDVYNAVLRVMKKATAMLVPGTILDEYHVEVGKLMEQELIGLGLLNAEEVKNQDPKKPLYKKYFMHGTSHFMGIDVHDVGNRYEPMKPGMVFTVEPGIYIPEENIGIRIENDILVTEGEPVDLMASIPIELEEIEAIMGQTKLAEA